MHGTVSITSNRDNIGVGEEIIVSVNSAGIRIASFELEIYFDSTKLEYLSGPELINVQENTILYTWVDKSGGNSPKQNEELVQFKFRTKTDGQAVLGINGRFFNEHGQEISPTLTQGIITIDNNVGVALYATRNPQNGAPIPQHNQHIPSKHLSPTITHRKSWNNSRVQQTHTRIHTNNRYGYK
ncbi:MAG: cohesin domain-containing protein [Oscillospiraceae bacterium]|nr:cohesin domain-containing protein [Oscillospiraceae bacterium]